MSLEIMSRYIYSTGSIVDSGNSKGKQSMPTIILSPSVQSIVDELGSIRAEIKRLETQDKALTAMIKESGAGTYTGAIWSALAYSVKPRVTIDWETIASKFSPSHQLITAHTTTGAASLSVKLSKV